MNTEDFNSEEFDFDNYKIDPEILKSLLGASGGELLVPSRKDIDYSRPLTEYATASTVADFIRMNSKKERVYSKDLRKDGIVVQDKMEKYLSNPAYGSNTIKQMLLTPMNFAFGISDDADQLTKLAKDDGKFDLGTFLHEAILEPTKFSRVTVAPENAPMSSLAGVNKMINFWTEQIIENNGGFDHNEEHLTPEQCFAMADKDVSDMGHTKEKIAGLKVYCKSLEILSGIKAITAEHFLKVSILKKHYENYANGMLPELLKHSKREISMYHTDEETGVNIKIRPDAIQFAENIGVNAIISVKSSGIKDLRAFGKVAAEMHYDLSEGMYQDVATAATGRDFNCTIMIMLQTVAPFAIAVLVWNPEDIEMGKYKYRMALRDIAACKESGKYDGFEAFAEPDNMGLINFTLPTWNNRELTPKT